MTGILRRILWCKALLHRYPTICVNTLFICRGEQCSPVLLLVLCCSIRRPFCILQTMQGLASSTAHFANITFVNYHTNHNIPTNIGRGEQRSLVSFAHMVCINSNLATPRNGTSRAPSPTPTFYCRKIVLLGALFLPHACVQLWSAMPIPHSSFLIPHSACILSTHICIY